MSVTSLKTVSQNALCEVVWWHERDLHKIRQIILMQWLIFGRIWQALKKLYHFFFSGKPIYVVYHHS